MTNPNDTVLIFSPSDPLRSTGLAADLRRDSGVRTAVVIQRAGDGQLKVTDADGADVGLPTVTGGLIGALIGILGGPVGVLLGWSVGTVGGAAVDLANSDDDQDGMDVLAQGIAAGGTVVMAETTDPSFPAEARAAQWDATVVRVPADQVAAQVDAARQAADAAAHAARQSRRQQRHDDFRAHMDRLFHKTHD